MNWNLIIYGIIGGAIISVAILIEIGKSPKNKRVNLRDPLVLLPLFFWPLVGGFLVHLYTTTNRTFGPITATYIGLSASSIVTQGFRVGQKILSGPIDTEENQ